MGRPTVLVFALALVLAACTTYEYEEEVFLEADGSGQMRVSGSAELLETLHDASSVDSIRARFGGTGLSIDSVRETERQGHKFVHVQGSFEHWNELCDHPAYRHRECYLRENDDGELELHLTLPSRERAAPDGVAPDALLAVRFHFPSSVRFHNSSAGIERGNIIGWEETVTDFFDSPEIVVDARFERRSVLATTAVVLGAAVGVVSLSVVLVLFLMVRKGRKQLADEIPSKSSGETTS